MVFSSNCLLGQDANQILLYKKLGVKEVTVKKERVKLRHKIEILGDTLKVFDLRREEHYIYLFNIGGKVDSFERVNKTDNTHIANYVRKTNFIYNDEGKVDSIITKLLPTKKHPDPSFLNRQKFHSINDYYYDDEGILESTITTINFFDKIDKFKRIFWKEKNGLVHKSVQFPYLYNSESEFQHFIFETENHFHSNGLRKKSIRGYKHLFSKKKIYKRKKQVTKYRYKFNSKK